MKAVTWAGIAILKKTSSTSEEEATKALGELRLAVVKGKREVNAEEKDVPKWSGTHNKEQSEENVVVEGAPMVEDTACVKKEATDEVSEEGAEEGPSWKVWEEMKVESVEEAKLDEEPKGDVGTQCESGDNSTSGDNTTRWDNRRSGQKATSGTGDAKPMPSGDVASSSSAALLVPTQGTAHLSDLK